MLRHYIRLLNAHSCLVGYPRCVCGALLCPISDFGTDIFVKESACCLPKNTCPRVSDSSCVSCSEELGTVGVCAALSFDAFVFG